MNGFNRLFIILILLTSCSRDIKTTETESLYLVYRNIEQVTTTRTFFWSDSKKFELSVKVTPTLKQIIDAFGKQLFIIRLGFIRNKNYSIEKIEYKNNGELLSIYLIDSRKKVFNDLGYPIFIAKQNISQIQILTNGIQYSITNK